MLALLQHAQAAHAAQQCARTPDTSVQADPGAAAASCGGTAPASGCQATRAGPGCSQQGNSLAGGSGGDDDGPGMLQCRLCKRVLPSDALCGGRCFLCFSNSAAGVRGQIGMAEMEVLETAGQGDGLFTMAGVLHVCCGQQCTCSELANTAVLPVWQVTFVSVMTLSCSWQEFDLLDVHHILAQNVMLVHEVFTGIWRLKGDRQHLPATRDVDQQCPFAGNLVSDGIDFEDALAVPAASAPGTAAVLDAQPSVSLALAPAAAANGAAASEPIVATRALLAPAAAPAVAAGLPTSAAAAGLPQAPASGYHAAAVPAQVAAAALMPAMVAAPAAPVVAASACATAAAATSQSASAVPFATPPGLPVIDFGRVLESDMDDELREGVHFD